MHKEERTVDINKQAARSGQINPIILRRGETGETEIRINITSDGAPLTISSYTAKFCAYLPDGGWVKDAPHVVKSTNYVTYTVNNDLTSQIGRITVCYVELTNGSKVLTTDCIPLVIEEDVSMTGQEAEEYTNNIDSLMAEVEKQLQEVNSAEKAVQDAEAKRVTAEQGRATAESTRQSNEQTRQSNETTRQSNETSRQSAESARSSAESKRVTAENGRVTAESGRVTAENGRVSAENTRVTEQAKNNADQAANNLAAAQMAPYTCVSGEYNTSTLVPTLTGTQEGRIYLVPSGKSGDDRFVEWMWLNGSWERVGTSSGGEITYITTDQIDQVANGEQLQGDTVLSLTGVSYLWAKIKEWCANTFRKAADKIQGSDIADNAITSGKIASGAVGTSQLAANAVTSAKIQDGTIVSADIASGAIAKDRLASDVQTSLANGDAAKAAWDSAPHVNENKTATDIMFSGRANQTDLLISWTNASGDRYYAILSGTKS